MPTVMLWERQFPTVDMQDKYVLSNISPGATVLAWRREACHSAV